MSHFDRTPSGLYNTLITIKGIFNLPYERSNCCSINSWVGRCCMTYGLAVWELYLLCWVRHLSDCASRIREEGERGGWKWDFIEHSVSWAGSLCESRDLTVAKSNQMFWGLTGPISQRLVAAHLSGSVWEGGSWFRGFADAEAKQCWWRITRRRPG